ncbi:MAG: hypothetical protein OXE80_10370 [Gammaproteobacteria bacterium]|nr:hypothetical protein [Gammaproteobacteria bacterium]MCY4270560.1 hypothetical protein [Gammaproteobacteria bacterium]MCY4296498.1 hypothetical protein [Gammaproteobacteria bacterium]
MNEKSAYEAAEKAKRKDEQFAAILACASIGVFFIWYWTGQIQSVIELLRLAYG